MKVINLTPHVVTILAEDNTVLRQISSEGVARASSNAVDAGTIDGIPAVRQEYGEVSGLPRYEEETMYIVSSLTVSAARKYGRTVKDLLIPAQQVRTEDGRILGCRSLSYVD